MNMPIGTVKNGDYTFCVEAAAPMSPDDANGLFNKMVRVIKSLNDREARLAHAVLHHGRMNPVDDMEEAVTIAMSLTATLGYDAPMINVASVGHRGVQA